MKETKIEISMRTIATLLLVAVGIYVFTRITDILLQIFVAFVLMTALNPIVNRLQKLKMSRMIAILLTYFLFVGSLIVIIAAIVPPFADQTGKLLTLLNIPSDPLMEKISHLRFTASEIWSLFTQYGGSLSQVLSVVLSAFSVLFTIFTVLVMSVYLILDRERLHTYVMVLFRSSNRDGKEQRSRELLQRIEHSLGSWVRGEFLLMVAIGVMTFIGLSILNIPYALPLAIFAGLMEALPNIGPTLSAIPAILVAGLSVSGPMAVVTTILYILIQQIENNFIVPQIMKRATGIRPLTTIILILIGVRFGGFIGALLVIPLYIVIRETLDELTHEIREMTRG